MLKEATESHNEELIESAIKEGRPLPNGIELPTFKNIGQMRDWYRAAILLPTYSAAQAQRAEEKI